MGNRQINRALASRPRRKEQTRGRRLLVEGADGLGKGRLHFVVRRPRAELDLEDLPLAAALHFHFNDRAGSERTDVSDHLIGRLCLKGVDPNDEIAHAQARFQPGMFGSTRLMLSVLPSNQTPR